MISYWRWAATAPYRAEVRKTWEAAIAARGGVAVEEVAETGSAGAERLMDLASELAEGKIERDAAVRRAKSVIATVTDRDSRLAAISE